MKFAPFTVLQSVYFFYCWYVHMAHQMFLFADFGDTVIEIYLGPFFTNMV